MKVKRTNTLKATITVNEKAVELSTEMISTSAEELGVDGLNKKNK